MTLVRCNKKTELMLKAKKQATGESMTELLEFAVFNMPYIPPKRMRK